MRHGGLEEAPNLIIAVLRKRRENTQRPREEGHVSAEAEIAAMQLQAKEGHKSPKKLGRGKQEFFRRALRGSMVLPIP